MKQLFWRILVELFLYNDYCKEYWKAKNKPQQRAAMSRYSAARRDALNKQEPTA